MNGFKQNFELIIEISIKYKVKLVVVELSYADQIDTWKELDRFFHENEIKQNVLLNITTTPRETIWTLLFYLRQKVSGVDYIYFRPKSYPEDQWLTNNYKTPRLLLKHSGVFDLEKQLVLFVVTGFDTNRLSTIVDHYDPDEIVLFCQSGVQFNNLERNQGVANIDSSIVSKVDIDCYNISDSGVLLNSYLTKYSEFNVVIASQGPKCSAIFSYSSYLRSNERVALAYVPAMDFNPDYSKGISESPIYGKLSFDE